MIQSYINSDLEFYEVLNAFPVLIGNLKAMHVNISNLKHGISIKHYFETQNYDPDEIRILVKKMNYGISTFLKNGNVYTISNEDRSSLEEE